MLGIRERRLTSASNFSNMRVALCRSPCRTPQPRWQNPSFQPLSTSSSPPPPGQRPPPGRKTKKAWCAVLLIILFEFYGMVVAAPLVPTATRARSDKRMCVPNNFVVRTILLFVLDNRSSTKAARRGEFFFLRVFTGT